MLLALILLVPCAYAGVWGGPEGRAIAPALVAAALASIPAGAMHSSWIGLHLPVLVVDLLLLAWLWRVALIGRAFWPLWIAAFQLLTVCSHFAIVALPGIRGLVYFNLQALWSLPGLIAMAIGVMLDRRYRHRSARERAIATLGQAAR